MAMDGSPMKEKVILELKDVNTDHLKNIYLKVYEGEVVTVIGGSGAGKSSLLMLLNRLDEPKRGEIRYKNQPMDTYSVTSIRKEIGLVFQSSFLFAGTVYKNLTYGPSLYGEWSEAEAKRLVELVQLPSSYLRRDVNDLSGGEKQRVALARTLANSPQVLLLDEAMSALDVKTAEAIEELIMGLAGEKQITIILVTHLLEQAERLGDRTVFMRSGKIVEAGATEKVFHHPNAEQLKEFLKE